MLFAHLGWVQIQLFALFGLRMVKNEIYNLELTNGHTVSKSFFLYMSIYTEKKPVEFTVK